MRALRQSFAFVTLSILSACAGEARAQTAVSYRFLEVSDDAGRPVAGAQVESVGAPARPLATDERGTLKDFPVYAGDFNTRGVKVSKPGHLTHEEPLHLDRLYGELLEDEVPGYDPDRIKIVLLREPTAPAERAAFEAARRRRELLLAVRLGDTQGARARLREGAEAGAADVRGIPAILWAAAAGNAEMVSTLLSAGADVRNKSSPGRRAVLHYLRGLKGARTVDVELVRALVRAGADVNAADRQGRTVLALAEQVGNAQVVELLRRAGARAK